jgi:hypothetical protein
MNLKVLCLMFALVLGVFASNSFADVGCLKCGQPVRNVARVALVAPRVVVAAPVVVTKTARATIRRTVCFGRNVVRGTVRTVSAVVR